MITSDVTDKIIQYEQGTLSETEVEDLFQDLIDSGLIRKMGDRYGLIANELLVAGICTKGVA